MTDANTNRVGLAYSRLIVTKADAERREFAGIASTPQLDRAGDKIDMDGATYTNPVPLLAAHDATRPIGFAWLQPPSGKGLPFRAKISTHSEPPSLKERLDTAWNEVRSGLIRAVSIGFRSLDTARIETGLLFKKIEILELSTVVIPANAGAVIDAATIKRYDVQTSRAFGRRLPISTQLLRQSTNGMSDADFRTLTRRICEAWQAESDEAAERQANALPDTSLNDPLNEIIERATRVVRNDVVRLLTPISERLESVERKQK